MPNPVRSVISPCPLPNAFRDHSAVMCLDASGSGRSPKCLFLVQFSPEVPCRAVFLFGSSTPLFQWSAASDLRKCDFKGARVRSFRQSSSFSSLGHLAILINRPGELIDAIKSDHFFFSLWRFEKKDMVSETSQF